MKKETLKNKLNILEKEFKNLGDKLELLADFACPGKYYNEEKATEYYTTKRKYEYTRQEINKITYQLIDIEKAKKEKENNKNNFVNSFGEATKRYIASGTYEKHQKRLSKQIINYISK